MKIENLLWGISFNESQTKVRQHFVCRGHLRMTDCDSKLSLGNCTCFYFGEHLKKTFCSLDLTQICFSPIIICKKIFSILTHFPIQPRQNVHISYSGWFQFRNLSMRKKSAQKIGEIKITLISPFGWFPVQKSLNEEDKLLPFKRNGPILPFHCQTQNFTKNFIPPGK